jgi:hypothetical protein
MGFELFFLINKNLRKDRFFSKKISVVTIFTLLNMTFIKKLFFSHPYLKKLQKKNEHI